VTQAVPRLVDHLFRHEAGRLSAALVRLLGPANLDLAEDVVQETLCHALEAWKLGRVPDNPAAWLRSAAKNRALDLVRRQRTRMRFAPDLAHAFASEQTLVPAVDAAFSEDALAEEQLRMMFACCDARLAPEAQVALVLKLLCGFGVGELAQAFLCSPVAMEKRLARGKAALRRSGTLAEVPGPQLQRRLEAVLDALYLLFNEGYHGAHAELAVRADLCAEAIRLGRLLAAHEATARPQTFALLALMCLHGARLPGRLDTAGVPIPLEEQDRALWDRALAREGAAWLARAGAEPPTALLLEAAIAAEHCFAPSFAETDWRAIVTLYDALLAQRSSPVVALNRAIALAQIEGPERGLAELRAIEGRERLARYPFYSAALGELHRRAGHREDAAEEFRRAVRLARSSAEKHYFRRKLAEVS